MVGGRYVGPAVEVLVKRPLVEGRKVVITGGGVSTE